MLLVTIKKIFKEAYKGGYAVGGFNINNILIHKGMDDTAIDSYFTLILQWST